jgi:NADPH2:quinone reductase
MRAVVVADGEVRVEDRPKPVPGPGEILVEVRAAGLNGADQLQKKGLYPPPPGNVPVDIPGLELAGIVVEVGPGVERTAVGDRVMSIVSGGGQAEFAVVPDATAMPVPEGLSWPEAGGFAEVFLTAHDALFTQCHLSAGERLLVNGAAGGVGLAAVQLGRAAGASVVASVRNETLREAVAAFGAEVVAPDETGGHGPYDVVIELVGAPNLATDLSSLATGGRVAVIGLGAGARTEIDLSQLMGRRATLRGSTLRARPLEEKAAVTRRVEQDVLSALATGSITVPVAAVFALEEAGAAYERFAAGGKLGKIVLETPAS